MLEERGTNWLRSDLCLYMRVTVVVIVVVVCVHE